MLNFMSNMFFLLQIKKLILFPMLKNCSKLFRMNIPLCSLETINF